ncbi:unnamed protein product [Bursaphelenchus okinawaensis]|uniref:AA_permease domain-containing protein n=1 Tax=Bursaphelenchus okinawaensis TaxID=465554 RepID=A0A811KBV3_9BILA|nr:unnamed protein product [Bursaphelenchus okinawaensis]CAG9098471.1 unnamed protein product [Bursaphelenchus okinawaensis]
MSSIQPIDRSNLQSSLDASSISAEALKPPKPSESTLSSESEQHSINEHHKMGLSGAVSFVCGNIIGAGLFITPSFVVQYTGSVGLAAIVWILSALISVLGAYSYVELGTSIRKSGADFAYLCYVGWFPAAFSFMSTGCLMMYPAIVAVQAKSFSEYLFQGLRIEFENEFVGHLVKVFVSFGLVWSICALNFFSLKKFSSQFQVIATTAKILAVASIVLVGFYLLIFRQKTENLKNPFETSNFQPAPLALAFYQALFAYDGWDILNFGIEEIDRPRQTMPLAILLGMIIVAATFMITNVAYFVVLPASEIKASTAIAQTFAQHSMGNFQYLMPFLTSLMLIGSLNSTIFASSRYLFAAARHGHMPSFLSTVNLKSGSPRAAIVFHSLLAFVFALIGDMSTLVNMLSVAQWLQRFLTMMALLYIRYKCLQVHPERIRTPIVLPIIFATICITLVTVTFVFYFTTAAVGLGFLLSAFVFYFVFMYDKTLMRIDGYREFCSTVNDKTTKLSEAIFNAKAQNDKDHSKFDGHPTNSP